MSKRPCPFGDDFQRQTKTRVNDQLANENSPSYMNQVYERTNALLFEGARRASMQPPTLGDSMPGCSGLPSSSTNADRVSIFEPDCDMEYEDYETYEMRLSRLDLIKRLEKRDPSPIPTANNLLTSFIHTSRRAHGPFSESEKNILLHQAKAYKQLNIESFMQNQEVNQPSNEGQPREDNGESKDLNDNNNKPMDF